MNGLPPPPSPPELRQARERIAACPTGSTVLASAARQAGLDPAHPDYDLQLHALADAMTLSGIDPAGLERQQLRDLADLAQIATNVAWAASMSPVRRDTALPDRLAADVLAADRAAGPTEPARRLFAAVGLGWQAGMVVGEDVGAVNAVHRIAATAARDPALRFGRITPGRWAEHTLQPVKARLDQRLGPQAASLLWIDAVHAGSQVTSAAPGPAPPQDAGRSHVGAGRSPGSPASTPPTSRPPLSPHRRPTRPPNTTTDAGSPSARARSCQPSG